MIEEDPKMIDYDFKIVFVRSLQNNRKVIMYSTDQTIIVSVSLY
jgi:hypothetical protein